MLMSLRQSWITCEFHTRLELSRKDKKEYLNIILESQIISFALSIYYKKLTLKND